MTDSELIDDLGGTVAVSLLCEVSPPAVAQWRQNGIPNARLMFLRLARPDVFPQVKQEKRRNPAATN